MHEPYKEKVYSMSLNSEQDEVVLYQADDGTTQLDVHLNQDTVWLTQKQMAELFDKNPDTIGLHVRNIYKEGELDADGTAEDSSVVQNEGKRKVHRTLRFYNLDVIISVGYRVKSKRGTLFRRWATQLLREHLVNGFTLNQQRLAEQSEKLTQMQQTLQPLSRRECYSLPC